MPNRLKGKLSAFENKNTRIIDTKLNRRLICGTTLGENVVDVRSLK